MSRVHAGHQAASGRSAYGAGGIEIGQLHAFLCHPVHARCLEMLLAKAGKVAVAGIVDHDIDKVWLAGKGVSN